MKGKDLAALSAVACMAYFVWASPLATNSLTLCADDEPGIRLTVMGTVVDEEGRPVAGAELLVYQTDASGRYTPERPMDEPHARLSGWLRTDAEGHFEIHTIRPGGYPNPVRFGDRERKIPAHIHIDVKADGFAERRLQAVFADDPLLRDPYWQEWVSRLRQPVLELHQADDTPVARFEIVLQRLDQIH